jgi:hypothetical protein
MHYMNVCMYRSARRYAPSIGTRMLYLLLRFAYALLTAPIGTRMLYLLLRS